MTQTPSGEPVLFERRAARVSGGKIAVAILSLPTFGFLLFGALGRNHAPLVLVLVAAWGVFCAIVSTNLPRLVYLTVTPGPITQRRYLIRRHWSKEDVGRVVLVDLAYPGAKGTTVPTAVLVAHDGRGLGTVILNKWTGQEVEGVVHALRAPVDDKRGGAPLTPDDLQRQWPDSISWLGKQTAYIQSGLVLLLIVAFGVALALLLYGNR